MPGDLQSASSGWGITSVPAAREISNMPASQLVGFQDQVVNTLHQGVIKGTTEREAGSDWEKSSSAGRVIPSMANVYLVVGTEILGREYN